MFFHTDMAAVRAVESVRYGTDASVCWERLMLPLLRGAAMRRGVLIACITMTGGSPTVAAESDPRALVERIQALSTTLQASMTAAFVTAVIVYCVVEICKLPLRFAFNMLFYRRWTQRLRERAVSKVPSNDHPPPFGLPPDLFVKQIESRVRAAMEGAEEPSTVMIYAAGASKDDIDRTFKAAVRTTGLGETAPEVIAAQTSVTAAIERNLDDLQISLTYWWPRLVHGFALYVSFSVILLFGREAAGDQAPIALMALIAIAAAYLASILRDIVKIISRLGKGR